MATSAELLAQMEAIKADLAKVTAEENKVKHSEAIKAARAQGSLIVTEANKAKDSLIAAATQKANDMVANAMAKAKTMLDRAEKGLDFTGPANPSRPRKGRVLADGRVLPLGRGKPSPTWVVVDLDSVDPTLIVQPATSALGLAVTLANSQATSSAPERDVVTVGNASEANAALANGADSVEYTIGR